MEKYAFANVGLGLQQGKQVNQSQRVQISKFYIMLNIQSIQFQSSVNYPMLIPFYPYVKKKLRNQRIKY